jgi:hypothetical protein
MRAIATAAVLILSVHAIGADTTAVPVPVAPRDSVQAPVVDTSNRVPIAKPDTVRPAPAPAAPATVPTVPAVAVPVAAPTAPQVPAPVTEAPLHPQHVQSAVQCPRQQDGGTPCCCGQIQPGSFGGGFRLLGETSDVLLQVALPRNLEIQVRSGWSYDRNGGKPERVVSNSRIVDLYVGDTMNSDQSYTGTGTTRTEELRGEVTALLVVDVPTERGVDLLLGAGPSWSYDRTTRESSVVGKTADTLDVGSWSHETDRSEGWGADVLLGFRWWLVQGRLALVGEMRTGLEWASTRGRAQDSSTQITGYKVPDGYAYRRTITSSHDTPTSSDDFHWKSRTAALGLDVFF